MIPFNKYLNSLRLYMIVHVKYVKNRPEHRIQVAILTILIVGALPSTNQLKKVINIAY